MLDEASFKKTFPWAAPAQDPSCDRSWRWSKVEIARLKRHYPERGSRWDGWKRLLPDRSPGSIAHKAREIGLFSKVRGPSLRWEDWEVEAVRTHYPAHGRKWDGWAEILPGRTLKAVALKAHELGVSSAEPGVRWTGADDRALAENYPAHGSAWDGWDELLPGRTRAAIACRAHAKGIYRRGRKRRL